MTFSLGESAALAVKATRGAGYPWALADEAGRAVRWCYTKGLDGCAALAHLLSTTGGASRPQLRGGIWSAGGGALCPIALGTTLSDRANAMTAGEVRTGAVVSPLLVLPFLADAARLTGMSFCMQWDGGDACVSGGGLRLSAVPPTDIAAMRIDPCTDTVPDTPPGIDRADPAPGSWDILLTLAHRTYAPATEASRLRGAGDGSAISE